MRTDLLRRPVEEPEIEVEPRAVDPLRVWAVGFGFKEVDFRVEKLRGVEKGRRVARRFRLLGVAVGGWGLGEWNRIVAGGIIGRVGEVGEWEEEEEEVEDEAEPIVGEAGEGGVGMTESMESGDITVSGPLLACMVCMACMACMTAVLGSSYVLSVRNDNYFIVRRAQPR